MNKSQKVLGIVSEADLDTQIRQAFANSPEGKQAAEIKKQMDQLNAQKDKLHAQLKDLRGKISQLEFQKKRLHDQWVSKSVK